MSKINLGKTMSSLEVGLKQAAFTGVILHAGQDESGNAIDYLAGNTNGNTLELDIPDGTKAMAQMVLDGLQKRGYQYQPFESGRTVTDPAVEIGDNVSANGTNSVVMGMSLTHSRLMAPTLKAPFDEEVNHEFKFESRTQRQFKRESAYTRSRLTINADNIAAEVARASKAEGELSSRISINADSITAEVARATSAEGSLSSRISINADAISAKVSKSGGNTSFGWTLTDTDWSLSANGSRVFRATKDGIEVLGKITATSGYIGSTNNGFLIDNYGIRKGMTSFSDTANSGVYIGTDGISLGGGKFKVDSAGNLTASSGTFSGNVYAKNIQYGGDYGTMGGGGITAGSIGTGTGSPLSSYAIGGIGGGVGFNDMNSGSVRAYIYGSSGGFSGGVSMTTLSATAIAIGDNYAHNISWGTYTYPTGVSASGYDYVFVETSDGQSVQVPRGVTASLITQAGTYFTYLKG